MNLNRIKSIRDCECRIAWCYSELSRKVLAHEPGQRMLRLEIKILDDLLAAMRSPELFQPKLQMIPINRTNNKHYEH